MVITSGRVAVDVVDAAVTVMAGAVDEGETHTYIRIRRRHGQQVHVHVQAYPLRHDIDVRWRGVCDVLEKTENKEVSETKTP
jgi:hypothetical protein